jgi:hypothetical protein
MVGANNILPSLVSFIVMLIVRFAFLASAAAPIESSSCEWSPLPAARAGALIARIDNSAMPSFTWNLLFQVADFQSSLRTVTAMTA